MRAEWTDLALARAGLAGIGFASPLALEQGGRSRLACGRGVLWMKVESD